MFKKWRLQKKYWFSTNKISAQSLYLFLEQFSMMIGAGLSITKIFIILQNLQLQSTTRSFVQNCQRIILNGGTLTQAFQYHAKSIDPLICQLIRIGESTGDLPRMFIIARAYQADVIAARRQLKQLLIYPCFLLIASISTLVIMFFFVIPHFQSFFTEDIAALPWLTRSLFSVSNFMLQYTWTIILTSCIMVLIFINQYQIIWQHLQTLFWRAPIARRFYHQIQVCRFIQQLSISLAAGIPLTESLQLLLDTNQLERNQMIQALRHAIDNGHSLTSAMLQSAYFPPYITDMIKVGEESGTLINILDQISIFLDKENQHSLQQMQQFVEPLILLMLGALIGGIVIGMYLPIFNIGNMLSP